MHIQARHQRVRKNTRIQPCCVHVNKMHNHTRACDLITQNICQLYSLTPPCTCKQNVSAIFQFLSHMHMYCAAIHIHTSSWVVRSHNIDIHPHTSTLPHAQTQIHAYTRTHAHMYRAHRQEHLTNHLLTHTAHKMHIHVHIRIIFKCSIRC